MSIPLSSPRSNLCTKATVIDTPCFDVIDAHNHLGDDFGGGWIHKPISLLEETLERARVKVLVDLDGGWNEDIFYSHLKLKEKRPERFRMFGGVDWSKWSLHKNRFGEWAAKRLQKQVEYGADGLKIWKRLGMYVHDHNNRLVDVNDERLFPLWHTASELKIPVLIHVGDPVSFFQPFDHHNERWDELNKYPEYRYHDLGIVDLTKILSDFKKLVINNPNTVFIGAHVGCYAENLSWVSDMLTECPNFYVDISGRINELGRQPYTSREFFMQHEDRILFGLDSGPNLESYKIYYRFLETKDEYFSYSDTGDRLNGRWNIYGIHLPRSILKKIYFSNAKRVILDSKENYHKLISNSNL